MTSLRDGVRREFDELRKKLGDAELNTEESREHFITKNYEKLDVLEGGDTG